MTDKPTPTTDLLKRCAEIHEWRSTGLLSGEALRDYAERKWPDRLDTLQMAEHETVTEALALLTKWGQPAQAAEPVAVVVPCYTPSGKRVALYSAKQDLPIGTKLYAAPQPSPTAQAAERVPAGPRRKDMLWSTAKMQERHDQRIENIVSGLERIKQEHAGQQPQKIDECYGDCPTDSTTCTNPCRFDGRAARDPADSVQEDAARLDFIERHPEMSLRHRKGKWAFLGFTNYEYEMLPSLRAAVDATRKQGGA